MSDVYATIAAKFAYMIVANKHPELGEVEREVAAATLLAGALEHERTAAEVTD